ncbi:dimethylhistidine N-methyltransferase [Streptomyces sp. NL15-2K]|nr:L-histidine N(alpha)-methyltransferase [Kutzneria buriramensis]WKX06883.1 L-histidine N(alpha)-methyltransferase [Kutzneria buriramensis]GCB44054.1 dimethylhistidine N-methyltransferase [Streptomyces sp. NL15-2K]
MSPFLLTRTLPEDATEAARRADVHQGLTHTPKTLPPKWFYDAHGSELFEQITELPEYYPTRAEREILVARNDEIAAATRARTLVELGSGSSEKTRHLIDALTDLHTYVPVDVSESALTQAGQALAAERPGLEVHALIADFTAQLTLPDTPGPRLLAFLGGTIGNLLPVERAAFLASLRALLSPGDALLLGTDLVKDENVLVRAYDDAAGVTAALCGSFILSVVRTARPTHVPKPRQRSRIGNGRTRPAPRSRRSSRAPSGPVTGRVPAAAGVARSTRKLRPRQSADVASTEERHA